MGVAGLKWDKIWQNFWKKCDKFSNILKRVNPNMKSKYSPPPKKNPFFRTPKTSFFLRKIFLKKIFRFFAWIFFDKLAVKVDRSGARMSGGGGGVFKKIVFGFLRFFWYEFKVIFPNFVFVFWEILVLGYLSWGECLDHKKSVSNNIPVQLTFYPLKFSPAPQKQQKKTINVSP